MGQSVFGLQETQDTATDEGRHYRNNSGKFPQRGNRHRHFRTISQIRPGEHVDNHNDRHVYPIACSQSPLKTKAALPIANAIYDRWICDKSVPLKIISDRAREFVSTHQTTFS